MSSLLTEAEKTAINSALSSIHDTFARDIHIYVKEASTVPTELNFNPLYGRNKNVAQIPSEITLTKYVCLSQGYTTRTSKKKISLMATGK